MSKIFIQIRSDGHFYNSDAFSAFEGFTAKGYEINTFKFGDNLDHINQEDIVFGSVWAIHSAMDWLGIKRPKNIDYPNELINNLGRRITETTVGEITSKVFDEGDNFIPVFIKPSRIHKSFNGYVLRKSKDLLMLSGISDDTHIYESTLVNFISEYRVFVLNGKTIGCKHYLGDWRVFPSHRIIETALNKYKDCPVSYAMDFGVTDEGKTLLVEVNDFHSLGSYGLDSLIYADCIEARWKEMVNNK